MSFIAWYLSLTSTGTVKTRLTTQAKKCHLFEIFHKNALFYIPFTIPKETANLLLRGKIP
jgi:hypothetical protein